MTCVAVVVEGVEVDLVGMMAFWMSYDDEECDDHPGC